MKLTHTICFALGALAAGVSQAQTDADGRFGAGLLGHRYTELSFGLQDIKHLPDHGYSLGAAANNPIIAGVLDGGVTYAYSWIRGAFKGHANTVAAYTTAYAPFNGVKPFLGAALGYQWSSVRFAGSDERGLWGLTTGVEIPAGAVTITPRISYADHFEDGGDRSRDWTFQVEANYWFSRTSAVYSSIGRSDVRRSPFDSWNYEIGLRARF